MDISVIICTWNNCQRLAITLESFLQCEIPDGRTWELILVNNRCTDETNVVTDQFKHRLPIVAVFEPVQGLSRARNAGMKQAQGKLVIFTDDDVRVCREWLSIYWQAYQDHPKGRFWGGPVESEFEGHKPDEELLEYAPYSIKGYHLGDGVKKLDARTTFLSANWACPRDVLEHTSGFDPSKGLDPSSGKMRAGEETDLMNRLKDLGLEGWYLPQARIQHFVPQDKCHLQHMIGRHRATAYALIGEFRRNPAFPMILGVPLELYRRIVFAWIRWLLAKLSFKKAYREYFRLQYALGTFKGFYDSYRSGRMQDVKVS